ncbi:MAG: hypothetical protein KKA32_01010 [Actinobacteria bacterium]|nr:hypothetical protein [Actinomycetota bacterium]
MTSGEAVNAYATYLNAGLRGSRFMGACKLGCADGQVWLTGHRMPIPLIYVRALCYVVFVPWVFLTMGAMGAVFVREPGWSYLVAVALALFIFIAVGLGGGDIWATHRGPIETVCWAPCSATPLRHKFDRTASAGPLAPTVAVRLVGGRSVTELRVPVGPRGKLRLLALRTSLEERDAPARVLGGAHTA